MSDIILTGDNVNEGRIKINAAYDDINMLFEKGDGENSIKQIASPANLASGDSSTAFNLNSSATTRNSHAQGKNTLSSGVASWAFGWAAQALGDQSFAGGLSSGTGNIKAVGENSFCFGEASNASNHIAYSKNSVILGGTDMYVDNSKNSGIFGGAGDGGYIDSGGSLGSSENIMLSPDNLSNINDVTCSFIVGGSKRPTASTTVTKVSVGTSTYLGSGIIGGSLNKIEDSNSSIIVGGGDNTSGDFSSFFGINVLTGSTYSSIIGSTSCELRKGGGSAIISAYNSNITGDTSIPYTFSNYASLDSVIVGGRDNNISLKNSSQGIAQGNSMIAGYQNEIIGSKFCSIIGGQDNLIDEKDFGFIGNFVRNCAIVGGKNNTIGLKTIGGTHGVKNSAIIGGHLNLIENFASFSPSEFVLMGAGGKNHNASGNTWLFAYNDFDVNAPNTGNNKIALDGTVGSWTSPGSINLGPADYAEYFEWNDGNTSNEDRVGYFTSLVGEKVEVGNINIVGIVSSTPAIVGDSASFKWKDMYQTDEWNSRVFDNYQIYKLEEKEIDIYIDSNQNVYSEPPNPTNKEGTLYVGDISNKHFTKNESIPILNPNYDSTKAYISRENRKEWSPIGLLGKLNVKTSEQITGGTISADSNGMAINGNDYHVLENKKSYDGNYGVVKILFK